MAGLDPNAINTRLAAIHQTLANEGDAQNPVRSPEEALAKAKGEVEALQRDVATVGHLAA